MKASGSVVIGVYTKQVSGGSKAHTYKNQPLTVTTSVSFAGAGPTVASAVANVA